MPNKIQNNLTFENAMVELEELTQRLEGGKDTLEESMSLYERGMLLKQFCEKKLKEAESKWTILKKNNDGSIKEIELSEEEKKDLIPNQTHKDNSDLF